jgi:hypothetical protein
VLGVKTHFTGENFASQGLFRKFNVDDFISSCIPIIFLEKYFVILRIFKLHPLKSEITWCEGFKVMLGFSRGFLNRLLFITHNISERGRLHRLILFIKLINQINNLIKMTLNFQNKIVFPAPETSYTT